MKAKLTKLERHIVATRERIQFLNEQAADLPKRHRDLFVKTISDLSAAIEELQVTGEDLIQKAAELQASQSKLKAERRRYQDLFNRAPDAYLVTDEKGLILDSNVAARILLNHSKSELLGQPLILWIDEGDRSSFLNRMRDLGRLGRLDDWELYLKPEGKKVICTSVSVSTTREVESGGVRFRWSFRDTTAHKRQEQLAQLASFAELSPNPLVEFDGLGHFYFQNLAARRVFPDLEAAGLSHPFLLGFDRNCLKAEGKDRTGEVSELEIEGRWFERLVFAIGGTNRFRAYGWEITDRKIAEQTLRERGKLNTALNDLHSVINSDLDPDKIIRRTLDLATRAIGCETSAFSRRRDGRWKVEFVSGLPESYVGTEMSTAEEPQVALAVKARLPVVINDALHDRRVNAEHMKKSGVRSVLVVPCLSQDDVLGVIFFYQYRRPVPFGPAQIDFARKLSSSISQSLGNASLLKKLRESEADLRMARNALEIRVQERTADLRRQAELLDLARDAIIVSRLDGTVRFWNSGAEKMYGWTKAEALGQISHKLLRTQFPISREKIQNALVSQGHWEGELIQLKKGGEKIETLSRWYVRKREEDGLLEVMEVHLDITDRKRAEEKLRQSQKMEALGTLAGGIAHDFNNILGTIVINSEVALHNAREGRFSDRPLELALEAANRGKELVKQVIAFARRKEMARRPLDLARTLRESVNFLRNILPKNIEIVDKIEAGPDCALVDETQVHQVIANLASNAAYAMRQLGGSLTISLEPIAVEIDPEGDHPALSPGAYFKIGVADVGEGIEPQVLPRIFDPFFTTKKQGDGTGMGLAVVQGIIESYGGAVRARSILGKGSTFEVFIPRIKGSSKIKTEEKSSLAEFPGGAEKILLVDDDRVQIQTIQNMLELLGYRVTTRTDGRKALEEFKKDSAAFDLMITDQTMPGISGSQLAEEVLRIRPRLPIILCTGFSEVIDESDAQELGIRGFMLKPFSIRQMAEAVRRVLASE